MKDNDGLISTPNLLTSKSATLIHAIGEIVANFFCIRSPRLTTREEVTTKIELSAILITLLKKRLQHNKNIPKNVIPNIVITTINLTPSLVLCLNTGVPPLTL